MAVPDALRPLANLLIVSCLISVAVIKLIFDIILHPFSAFKKTSRNVPPKCLLDSSLGTHEYVTANGIKFHYVTAGDKSKPLMLLMHGFPDFWYGWRHQMREFNKDYRVVAIDMRGYGETERPPLKKDYLMKNLVGDVTGLVAALGYSSCVLVGHDWGGLLAWNVASAHPEVVDRLIVLNCPHPKLMRKQMLSSFSQIMRSWYIFLFRLPRIPELMLSVRDYHAFDGIYRTFKNKDNVTPELIEAYKYTFAQPGAVTAAINYYRAHFLEGGAYSMKPIEVPTLLIWGDKDFVFDLEMVDKHTTVGSNVTVRHIADCSHWVPQDCPTVCNQYMREFLDAGDQ